MAYETIQPFDYFIGNYRAAVIAAGYYNANQAKGAKPVSPFDVLKLFPFDREPDKVETPQEREDRIAATMRAMLTEASKP